MSKVYMPINTMVCKEFSHPGPGIKRGDIIRAVPFGYRNDGVQIWDGEKAIELEDDPDDYGTLPRCFEIDGINEFTPDYWHGHIDHNAFVWFSEDLIKKMNEDKKVTIHGKTWKVRGEGDTFYAFGDVIYST